MPATAWMCGGGRFFCGGAMALPASDRARGDGVRGGLHCTAVRTLRIDACLRANCDESVWHYLSFLLAPNDHACVRFTAAAPSCWLGWASVLQPLAMLPHRNREPSEP